MPVHNRIADFAADMTDWRRDIHAHPELAFGEHRTSDIVADKLASWGIEVTRGIAGTGLVGTLRAAASPRAIGIRADMDALPMPEANEFESARRTPASCTPAAMTATPPCCWAPRATWPRRAISTARCISSSSPPRRTAAAAR